MRFAIISAALVAGCAGDGAAQDGAVLAVKDLVASELAALRTASARIRDSAPSPDPEGWAGGAELDAGKAAWKDARVAYERIEGAIAVLFPDLDASTDERYDGFLAEATDSYLFDGEGVIGVHAIERILWADAHPAYVVAFESALPGYTPAAFPGGEQQASDYRDALAQRLVDDVATMESGFLPLALDPAAAYGGVVGSMGEQLEKVALAATGEDESRYSQHTLGDMRANLDGGLALYEAFSPWVSSVDGGKGIDGEVRDGFSRVSAAYDALSGDAIPPVPASWDPTAPSTEDLATPYGALWLQLSEEADAELHGSLVERMVKAAAVVGIEIAP